MQTSTHFLNKRVSCRNQKPESPLEIAVNACFTALSFVAAALKTVTKNPYAILAVALILLTTAVGASEVCTAAALNPNSILRAGQTCLDINGLNQNFTSAIDRTANQTLIAADLLAKNEIAKLKNETDLKFKNIPSQINYGAVIDALQSDVTRLEGKINNLQLANTLIKGNFDDLINTLLKVFDGNFHSEPVRADLENIRKNLTKDGLDTTTRNLFETLRKVPGRKLLQEVSGAKTPGTSDILVTGDAWAAGAIALISIVLGAALADKDRANSKKDEIQAKYFQIERPIYSAFILTGLYLASSATESVTGNIGRTVSGAVIALFGIVFAAHDIYNNGVHDKVRQTKNIKTAANSVTETIKTAVDGNTALKDAVNHYINVGDVTHPLATALNAELNGLMALYTEITEAGILEMAGEKLTVLEHRISQTIAPDAHLPSVHEDARKIVIGLMFASQTTQTRNFSDSYTKVKEVIYAATGWLGGFYIETAKGQLQGKVVERVTDSGSNDEPEDLEAGLSGYAHESALGSPIGRNHVDDLNSQGAGEYSLASPLVGQSLDNVYSSESSSSDGSSKEVDQRLVTSGIKEKTGVVVTLEVGSLMKNLDLPEGILNFLKSKPANMPVNFFKGKGGEVRFSFGDIMNPSTTYLIPRDTFTAIITGSPTKALDLKTENSGNGTIGGNSSVPLNVLSEVYRMPHGDEDND